MTLIYKTNFTTCMPILDRKQLVKIPDQTKVADKFTKNVFQSNMFSRGFGKKAPYDFAETYRILDTETFVSSAFRKKKTLMLKSGFQLISEQKDDVKYIKRRFQEMHHVTKKSFKEFIEEVTSAYINNHNVFILPVRKKKSSSGLTRRVDGKVVQPIAGYYVLPETKISVLEDEMGVLVGYKYQVNNSRYRYFEPDEILHLAFDRKPGFHLGTPPLEAMIDDLIALRQIEESLERLIYKLSIPIIHAKVGTVEKPAGIDRFTGEKEVDQVNAALQHMEDAGGITTSERVEFKMLGAESQALRLSGYLEYFKNRVLVGLSMSDLDFGVANSTSAGSADMVTKALKENVEMYQRGLEDFITDNIIAELLLESEKYSDEYYLDEDDKVVFKLTSDNLDERIKRESHYINEVNANLITADEYRVATGRRPLTAEEKAELDKKSGNYYQEENLKLAKKAATTAATVAKANTSQDKVDTTKTTASTNQHSDKTVVSATKSSANESVKKSTSMQSPIKDSVGLHSYVKYLYNGQPTVASHLLSKNLEQTLKDSLVGYSVKDIEAFSSGLTSTLQSYIIGRATRESTIELVEKLVCDKILEIIHENLR